MASPLPRRSSRLAAIPSNPRRSSRLASTTRPKRLSPSRNNSSNPSTIKRNIRKPQTSCPPNNLFHFPPNQTPAPLPTTVQPWIYSQAFQQKLRLKLAWLQSFLLHPDPNLPQFSLCSRCSEGEAPSLIKKKKWFNPFSGVIEDPEKHRKRLQAYHERFRNMFGREGEEALGMGKY